MQATHDVPPQRLTYRVHELAAATGIGQRTIRRYIEVGRLDTVRPSPGVVLITDESVQALLRGER